MTEYNHRICERCWFDGSPERLVRADGPGDVDLYDGKGKVWELVEQGEPIGVIKDGEHKGAYRMPAQWRADGEGPEPGACCFCGGMTITGIWTRIHQDEVLCKGRHEPDQLGSWSRVGI